MKISTPEEHILMKNLIQFSIYLFLMFILGCLPDIDNIKNKFPKNIDITRVEFGEVTKRKVGPNLLIDYPCQVLLCIRGVDSLRSLMNVRGAALFIKQKIQTKDGMEWLDEAYMPLTYITEESECFKCNIYHPSNNSAPKEALIKGNIKSYEYSIQVTNCNGCEKVFLKSGVFSNL